MAWPWSKTIEERSEPTVDDVLLSSFLSPNSMTKAKALEIPAVKSCVDFAANTVSMLPIKLYEEHDGKVTEIREDPRIKLLNDDTGDTLDAVQFWRAIIEGYYLGKGGYAYINKQRGQFKSLHFVDDAHVSVLKNADPIFKDYKLHVNGTSYQPFEFIKVLRNTKDGAGGSGLIHENGKILSVAYNSLVFEDNLVSTGGNKKGFLKSPKRLTQDVIDKLKSAWKRLYSNNEENVVVLNEGIEFQEASNTSVEMQLNENKKTNAGEICKLFLFSENLVTGNATEKEYNNSFKSGILPLLRAIECALNRDMLLEKEKKTRYFAFDTREVLKGSIKERYDAYKVGIDANFIGIDEVRYMEDLEPLGIDWIKLGLDSVLYNPETKEIYTPNTNMAQNMTNLEKGGAE